MILLYFLLTALVSAHTVSASTNRGLENANKIASVGSTVTTTTK